MPKTKLTKDCCPEESQKKYRNLSPSEELAQLAKALGHPIRMAIIDLLKIKNTCICGEIVNELPLAQSTVSQHLKVLKKVGLVRGTISGPATCYCLNYETLKRFKTLATKL